jgi:hypothetical protein
MKTLAYWFVVGFIFPAIIVGFIGALIFTALRLGVEEYENFAKWVDS